MFCSPLVVDDKTTGSEVATRLQQGGEVHIPAALLEKMEGFESAVRSLMGGRETFKVRKGGNFIFTARHRK